MEESMARRRAAPAAPEAPAEETQAPEDGVGVTLIKACFLHGRKIPAGEQVTVPERIATLLRSKGVCK
jgi:hypothetical protein